MRVTAIFNVADLSLLASLTVESEDDEVLTNVDLSYLQRDYDIPFLVGLLELFKLLIANLEYLRRWYTGKIFKEPSFTDATNTLPKSPSN